MAVVKYSIHETPNPQKDGKKRYHARVVSDQAVKTEQLALTISEMSSFSSADVKGMLEAFSQVLKMFLAQGSSVELEGIGLFNISISCPTDIEDPSKINASKLRFKKVNFKGSVSLNNELKALKFERAENDKNKKTTEEADRLKKILNYVKDKDCIQSSDGMKLNNCTRYIALKDLNSLVKSGKLIRHGNKASSIYLPIK